MNSLETEKRESFYKSKCNTNALKSLIVAGRELKNVSQRELARRIGISNTTINDLERGNIQKPGVEILINISEELEISINMLLKAAGYGKLLTLLNNDNSKIIEE